MPDEQRSGAVKRSRAWVAWVVWGSAAAFVLYQFVLQTSPGIFVSQIERDFDVGAGTVGALSASFFYTYLIMQIPGGILVDRFGPRRVLSVCVPLAALAAFIFARADGLFEAQCGRLLMGLASGPAVAAALVLAATWFPPARFALIAGMTEMLGMVGGGVNDVFLARWVANVGWRDTMLGLALFGVALTLLAWFVVRNRPRGLPPVSVAGAADAGTWLGLVEVLKSRQVWLAAIFGGLTFAVISVFASLWCVPYIRQVCPLVGAPEAATAASALFWGAAVGAPCLGWLSDRVGRRKPIMFGAALACVFASLAIVLMPRMPLWAMISLLAVLGFASGVYVIAFAVVRESIPLETRGVGLSFANMMFMVTAPVLQPLIGYLIELGGAEPPLEGTARYSTDAYQWALAILPLMLVAAVGVVFFIRETNLRDSLPSVRRPCP